LKEVKKIELSIHDKEIQLRIQEKFYDEIPFTLIQDYEKFTVAMDVSRKQIKIITEEAQKMELWIEAVKKVEKEIVAQKNIAMLKKMIDQNTFDEQDQLLSQQISVEEKELSDLELRFRNLSDEMIKRNQSSLDSAVFQIDNSILENTDKSAENNISDEQPDAFTNCTNFPVMIHSIRTVTEEVVYLLRL
jgi:hypothetical protein